jgi:hypothetical protein
MEKFDNIKCMDLTTYDYDKLDEISRFLKIGNINALSQNKKNGICKIWIDTINRYNIIAYTVVDNPDEIIIADNFIQDLKNIKPIFNEFIKDKLESTKSEESSQTTLEIDTILDKIGQYGISSLTKEEKDFLKKI